jgi:hypothetical protein
VGQAGLSGRAAGTLAADVPTTAAADEDATIAGMPAAAYIA